MGRWEKTPLGMKGAVPAVQPAAQMESSFWPRGLNQTKAAFLAGPDNAIDPFFSPDGEWIGFFADNRMQKIWCSGILR